MVVVGAGLAGLCCAGELVTQGARPLLICEAKEVGVALRSHMVDGNRGMCQLPTWQISWGGGWWPDLARRLNATVKTPKGYGSLEYRPSIPGLPPFDPFPQTSMSASTLVDKLIELFPMVADMKDDFERIVHIAINIPYEELVHMHDVRLSDWLVEQGASEIVAHFMIILASFIVLTSADFSREHVSVFGAIGMFRSFFCGDANFGFIYPDAREGLAVPLAQAIEARGGTIWRGRRVGAVNVGDGRIGSVVMQDGTEVQAPHVVMACPTARIATLLDPIPPELEAPLAYGDEVAHQDFNVFVVADQPVIPDNTNWVGVITMEGNLEQWMGPLHHSAPWTTQPGKQFLACGNAFRAGEVKGRGGEQAVLDRLYDVACDYYPGLREATTAVGSFAHKPGHLWYGQAAVGPKLPRRSHSVDGLWFANESTAPVYGLWMEAGASAGILTARAIKQLITA